MTIGRGILEELNDENLPLGAKIANEAKYLGIRIDRKINSKTHLKNKTCTNKWEKVASLLESGKDFCKTNYEKFPETHGQPATTI